MSGDIGFATATRLVAALRAGEVSSRELLDHYLARVERLDPAVNAVVVLDEDRAAAAARRADEALARGGPLGPLHGLPMTVKECFEAEGMRTTCGAPVLAGHVSSSDADVVARLRGAGAVVFGKTNLPIWCSEGQSFNDVYGVTRNPWDPARSPGGSSGGSAAAMAAGLSGLEVGGDIAGSIRNPAHTCGVYGLKPSYGIVSSRGSVSSLPGALAPQDLAVVGPLARSVDDLELALDVLVGPREEETAWRIELPPPRHRALGEFRIAAWLDDPWAPVDGEVAELLEAAVAGLERAGARVERRPGPAPLEECDRLYRSLLMAAISGGVRDEEVTGIEAALAAMPPDADDLGPRHMRGLVQRHRDWLAANEARAQLRRRWAAFFRDYDALMCPVLSAPAIPHDHRPGGPDVRTIEVNGQTRPVWDLVTWVGIANLLYLPAASIPIGRTRTYGLPVGLQIIGPYLEDRTVLELARRADAHLPGFETPPGFD